MAKASVTSIRPPSSTTEWVPAKTDWDLNNLGDRDSYFALNGSNAFGTLSAQLNLAGTGLVAADLVSYDYIFFGVNGGAEEKVTGVTNMAGIIATGNGKDNITGGDLGDLIFAGNGSDIAHGGTGNDAIYGENGSDKLYGDANNDNLYGNNGDDLIVGGTDTGTFQFSAGEVTPNDGVTVFDTDPSGTTTAGSGNTNNEVMQTAGVFVDGEDVHLVMTFEPKDHAPSGLGTIDVTVAVYDDAFNVLSTFEANFAEDQKNYFTVELGDTSEHVAVFLGHGLTVGDGNPKAADSPLKDLVLKAQGVGDIDDYVSITQGEFQFTAGDVLTGGADADVFQYAQGDGVDEILDFNRADGDILKLVGFTSSDVSIQVQGGDSYVMFNNGSAGYTPNAAIKVTGIIDLAPTDMTFM